MYASQFLIRFLTRFRDVSRKHLMKNIPDFWAKK